MSDNIADIIGTDILTNILYRYLGRGPITDISLIYRLIYRDINYIVVSHKFSRFCIVKHSNFLLLGQKELSIIAFSSHY
ncbi:hypothetical protein HanIR_Chr12g0584641 [Helianthus annuus]|nr:hypothetical protein HanIR_Chr12g0584641 [Helianthus annuus]